MIIIRFNQQIIYLLSRMPIIFLSYNTRR